MFALLLASVFCLQAGATIETTVETPFSYSAKQVHSSDPTVAQVTGFIPSMGSSARITVKAVGPGEAQLFAYFPSGGPLYSWRPQLGTVFVDDPLAVTLAVPQTVVAVGTPVTLSAMTSGSDVHVAWYEGERYLGIGSSISLTLSQGTHRIRAEAWNRCGTVTGEVDIAVVKPRQRAVRH